MFKKTNITKEDTEDKYYRIFSSWDWWWRCYTIVPKHPMTYRVSPDNCIVVVADVE